MKLLKEITNDPTYAELVIGEIIDNTTVVTCTKLSNRVEGDSYATWVAIFIREDHLHPYVVWNVIARPNGFIRECGDYCESLSEAMEYYRNRGGLG
jgi:hypothetical protein